MGEKNREESGLGEHNYCRNVGGNDVGVWCYTTDKSKRLELCDVPVCEGECNGITPSKRLECGFAGIKEDVCKKTGCCWDNSIKGVKWCFQPKDKKEDCQKSSTKGKDYRGTVSVTKSGKTCQAWNVQSPQKHGTYTEKNREESGLGEHNYCRNVGGNDVGVWCYTTDKSKRL